jgi:hypothetical protein
VCLEGEFTGRGKNKYRDWELMGFRRVWGKGEEVRDCWDTESQRFTAVVKSICMQIWDGQPHTFRSQLSLLHHSHLKQGAMYMPELALGK